MHLSTFSKMVGSFVGLPCYIIHKQMQLIGLGKQHLARISDALQFPEYREKLQLHGPEQLSCYLRVYLKKKEL